jgi:hypothetical protein
MDNTEKPSSKDEVKTLRKHIDACINEAKELGSSRALSLVVTKLEEAKMWGGKRLEELNPDDYPTELRDKAE